MDLAAQPGEPIPYGRFPRTSLFWQRDHLYRMRPDGAWSWQPNRQWGDQQGKGAGRGRGRGGGGGWGGKGGNDAALDAVMAAAAPFLGTPEAAAALPALLAQAREGKLSGVMLDATKVLASLAGGSKRSAPA